MQVHLLPHYKPKATVGFTLIELMVVIGIISIMTFWAVPSMKKGYNDFCAHDAFDALDTFFSAQRANYLILNEPVLNSNQHTFLIETSFSHFLPNKWLDPSTLTQINEHSFYNAEAKKPKYFQQEFSPQSFAVSVGLSSYLLNNWNDLQEQYTNRGYSFSSFTHDTYSGYNITLPEKHNEQWFR